MTDQTDKTYFDTDDGNASSSSNSQDISVQFYRGQKVPGLKMRW